MKAYLGIDPGASGCAVIIEETGNIKICRFDKSTDKDISNFFSDAAFDYGNNLHCIKERVWAIPAKDGEGNTRKMGAATSFTFGENNGKILGMLVATGISFEEKTPQTWQKFYGIKREKNESQTDYKRRLKQKAEELFPHLKITNDVADALLIAEYCRRTKV